MPENDKDKGFIVISRNILDWEWFQDANTLQVFLYLILKANWKDKVWQRRKIKRGQLVTSLAKLSLETGLSVRSVRTALEHLQATNQVTSETTPKYRIITIKNYSKYQDVANKPTSKATNNRQSNDKQPTSKRQTTDKLPTTTKPLNQSTTYSNNQGNQGTSAEAQSAPPGHEGQGQEDEKPRVPVPGSGIDENGFRVYEV